jgi:hypothetical protein
MLESVHNERFKGLAGEHFVVHYYEILKGAYTFNLREKDEGIQVVVLEDNLLQLGEFLKFLKILMVYNQVEADIGQVHLLYLVIELGSLQDFESVTKDIEYLIRFYLGMAGLDK